MDFIHVHDIARSVVLALDCAGDNVPVNIGTGIETSGAALAIAVGQTVGSIRVKPVPPREKIDGISRRRLSINRIREDLGWEPQIKLDVGLTVTHRWMQYAKDLWDMR